MSVGPANVARADAAARIAADARWFPFDFDPRSATVGFVEADWNLLAAQTFLDARWDLRAVRRERVPVRELVREPDGVHNDPALNFIWHTGFCCSTLLARAITARNRNLSLCEPRILVDVADIKRAGMFLFDRSLAGLPGAILPLLARSAGGARATTKPSPAANYLLPEAARLTSGRMLFLYSDCRSFVIAIARLGGDGWSYVRQMFTVLLRSGRLGSEWSGPRLWDLSDLQVAAFVWHLQIDEFRRNWHLLGGERAHSLDCDALITAPGEVLALLDDVLGLGLGPDHIAETVAGPLFRLKAKGPRAAFDAERRRAEYGAVAKQLGADLDRSIAWSYEAFPSTPRAAPLPNALKAIDKAYHP